MRAITILAGLAMAASFFMTWAETPFAGPSISPASVFRDVGGDLISGGGWQVWVFIGGFAAAALVVLFGVLGRGIGLFAFLAGLSPIVMIVDAYLGTADLRQLIGPIPIDLRDLGQAGQVLGDFARVGLWAYLGGAMILLIAGFSSLAPRR